MAYYRPFARIEQAQPEAGAVPLRHRLREFVLATGTSGGSFNQHHNHRLKFSPLPSIWL
jgi:hypothetical protein